MSYKKGIIMKRILHHFLLMVSLLLTCSGAFAQTWEERIVNGDFEGSDYSSFAINVKVTRTIIVPGFHLLQILGLLSSLSN